MVFCGLWHRKNCHQVSPFSTTCMMGPSMGLSARSWSLCHPILSCHPLALFVDIIVTVTNVCTPSSQSQCLESEGDSKTLFVCILCTVWALLHSISMPCLKVFCSKECLQVALVMQFFRHHLGCTLGLLDSLACCLDRVHLRTETPPPQWGCLRALVIHLP